jgi:hypothetical protein
MNRQDRIVRDAEICEQYRSEKYTTIQIAQQWHLERRQIQRIVENCGILRSQADANRVAARIHNDQIGRILQKTSS